MIPGSANPLLLKSAAAAGGYQVSRSLRFNSSDSGFCSRTPAVAGNRKTWTWAGWVKRSDIASAYSFQLFSAATGATDATYTALHFYNNALRLQGYSTGYRTTTAIYRDPGAWMHVVCAVDTTQATGANRIKLYVNGIEVTTFSTSNDPSQNADLYINSTNAHRIGSIQQDNAYSNGYLADIHFIDGQALTPSSFTEVSATTGQLIPKAYTGTFGTNGFWLKFSDNSAATAATLGKDYSGNSNNWTPNNLSVTAGAGNDSLVDTPTSFGTDTGVGGEVRGNYATLNPLDKATTGGALSNGNLDYAATVASWDMVRATFGISSGKWYWEVSVNSTTYGVTGIAQASVSLNYNFFNSGICYGYNATNGYKYEGSPFAALAYGAAWNGSGDICGVAFNSDAGTLTFYKNGVSQGVAYTGLTGTFFPAHTSYPTGSATFNFGQRAFAYTAPSGFKALCDTNLPAPLTAKPNTVFDVVTRTFTGASASITSLAFAPDFLWFKRRNDAASHSLFDSVRGVSGRLLSNGTNAEITVTDALTSFDSNGFTLGVDSGSISVNGPSSGTGVVWAWDAGTTTASNGSGSITSQVRANVSAGFSVATLTTPGSGTFTVGHGLNVAPSLVICKARNAAFSWIVYHRSAGAGNVLVLNTTAASVASATIWQNTNPSSTIVYGDASNWGTADYVMYSFAPVVGYSSFGSYTGNGSTDGPFVYLGFKPRWIMLKMTNSVSDWWIYDTARDTYNVMGSILYPNLSAAEYVDTSVFGRDILSNGFKVRTSNGTVNGNGFTCIYAAFAENPFQYARAR